MEELLCVGFGDTVREWKLETFLDKLFDVRAPDVCYRLELDHTDNLRQYLS